MLCSSLFLCRTGRGVWKVSCHFLAVRVGWSEGQTNKLSSGYHPGRWRVHCKAVTVACVFVIFLCQCGFLSSFSPLRVLPLSQPHGFCEKSAYCAPGVSVGALYCSPRSSVTWPRWSLYNCLSSFGPDALTATGFSLFKPERATKLNHLSFSFLADCFKIPSSLKLCCLC